MDRILAYNETSRKSTFAECEKYGCERVSLPMATPLFLSLHHLTKFDDSVTVITFRTLTLEFPMIPAGSEIDEKTILPFFINRSNIHLVPGLS